MDFFGGNNIFADNEWKISLSGTNQQQM